MSYYNIFSLIPRFTFDCLYSLTIADNRFLLFLVYFIYPIATDNTSLVEHADVTVFLDKRLANWMTNFYYNCLFKQFYF